MAASWRKRLDARLPPLGSRVRVSVSPCGFRGGRKWVWVGFSRGFSRFPLPQISFHHFSILISSISFHFNSPCDGASGVVGRHPCYSLTYNIGASSHLIPRPDLVLDTSWGYYYYYNHYRLRCITTDVRGYNRSRKNKEEIRNRDDNYFHSLIK